MENKSGINYQELSALARILNRALTADERVSFMDWVDASYDFLEEACNDVSIDVLPVIDDFKTTVLISFKIPHTLARVPSAILAAAFRSAVRGGEGVFWG